MTSLPDPGGVFASDSHRRALGHLPLPGDTPSELNALGHRISEDAHHGLETVNDLATVLHDLEADGHAESTDDGWVQTPEGLDALNAPLPNQPTGPVAPAPLVGLEPIGGVR